MRILFDQATPVPLRSFLEGHTVRTAAQEKWDRLGNGELLNAAEAAAFDVFVTTDKNMRYQQNLAGRKIAIVLLSKQQWPDLQAHVQLVVAAVNAAAPGSYKFFIMDAGTRRHAHSLETRPPGPEPERSDNYARRPETPGREIGFSDGGNRH